jgi:uncharacterized RDD family membrane protein YckC
MDAPPPSPNPYEPPKADLAVPAAEADLRHDLASRWRRLGAAMVDGILLALASAPTTLVQGGILQCGVHVGRAAFRPDDTSTPGVISTVLFIALMAIQSYFISTRGHSIGKRMLGTRIVTVSGGQASFLNAVVLRTWVPLLMPLVPIVGSFVAVADVLFIFGSGKRCLHDLAAGTKVVEAD